MLAMDSPIISDWLFEHAARSPGSPAVGTPTTWLSYGELAARVEAFAGHLTAAGTGPGDRVLLSLPNCLAGVVAGLAVHMLGATSVEVSREWRVDALADVAARSRPRQAIVWSRDVRTWASVLSGSSLERVWLVGPPPPTVGELFGDTSTAVLQEDGRVGQDAGSPAHPARVRQEVDGAALILFTSGSTGRPHGVVQTFANIDANSRSIAEYLALTADDRALLTLPLSYCYGRSVLQTHLLVGGSLFMDGRMAFPRVVLEAAAREGCTGLAGVPLTFELIRRGVDVADMDFPRLRYLTQAGGPMAPATIDWVRTAFAPAQLYVMYGQTEATARLAYLPPDRAAEKSGSVGVAIPGVELRVVDEAGRDVLAGEVGELVARGANVTLGYFEEPDETSAILRDGWLWTGDLARLDQEGFVYLEGRAKAILKIGGHRVSPVEIEHVLLLHPGVSDVAVLGVPDELLGERAVAVIVTGPGGAPSVDELLRFCRERLAPHEVPSAVIEADRLPRSDAGKLLRSEVAARFGAGSR